MTSKEVPNILSLTKDMRVVEWRRKGEQIKAFKPSVMTQLLLLVVASTLDLAFHVTRFSRSFLPCTSFHSTALFLPHVFQAAAVRRYTTAAPSSNLPSNLPAILLGTGILSAAGAYWYLDRSPPKQEKSPLDPNNFIDFKLKKVVPYNHNSSTSVFPLPFRDIPLIYLLASSSSCPTMTHLLSPSHLASL